MFLVTFLQGEIMSPRTILNKGIAPETYYDMVLDYGLSDEGVGIPYLLAQCEWDSRRMVYFLPDLNRASTRAQSTSTYIPI